MARPNAELFTREILTRATIDSFAKLDPRLQLRNPVMFVVEIGSVITTATFFINLINGGGQALWFTGDIAIWLWLTVLFANFAEAIAEGRGKAQADALRAMRTTTSARRRREDGSFEDVPAPDLRRGDIVVVEAGEAIPADGDVIEGIGSVDESAITGESAPVIRESGGDRSAVTGGTRLLSDQLVVQVTQEPGQSFLDRMIALVEGAERRKTPNEIALNILLAGLTLIFVIAVATLQPFAVYANSGVSTTVLICLVVALIPTTIGALLSCIGIAGMDRMVRRNVLALSGRAVEAAGDIDVLLLDKTGTITLGNRQAVEFIAAPGVEAHDLAEAAQLSSLADETPEGRSIVVLAKQFGVREHELSSVEAEFVPFSAMTRMSGVNMNGTTIRKGATDAVKAFVEESGGRVPAAVDAAVDRIAREGGTPLVVARDNWTLGVIYLKDIVKGGIAERFQELRRMGIRTVMITGDNPVTAAFIANESGVDDFLAQATPENKMDLIKEEQAKGRMVAMTGDGTNDAPALAQADVGVAMNTGTQAAKEAGNMVDLDSNPTKLIEVVEVGKQLLITRGALTTFSIANDVAKYFAILPAMFAYAYGPGRPAHGPLWSVNIMHLGTPLSAITSAIIFNALIIPLLIPLSLRGVRYRAIGATALLRRNLLIYGLGGIIAPFVGIKLIDLVVHNLLGA
jgi:potassium-transporting ATPase ATP-binding subunit